MQQKQEIMEQQLAQLMRQFANPPEDRCQICCWKHFIKHVGEVQKPNCFGEILEDNYHFDEVLDIQIATIILLKYWHHFGFVLNCFYVFAIIMVDSAYLKKLYLIYSSLYNFYKNGIFLNF